MVLKFRQKLTEQNRYRPNKTRKDTEKKPTTKPSCRSSAGLTIHLSSSINNAKDYEGELSWSKSFPRFSLPSLTLLHGEMENEKNSRVGI